MGSVEHSLPVEAYYRAASMAEASPPAPSSWLGFASSSASNRENAKRVSYGDITLYIAALPEPHTKGRRSVRYSRELAAPSDDALCICGSTFDRTLRLSARLEVAGVAAGVRIALPLAR